MYIKIACYVGPRRVLCWSKVHMQGEWWTVIHDKIERENAASNKTQDVYDTEKDQKAKKNLGMVCYSA